MSVLKADTIQSTGGGAATLTKQSAAKAWTNIDGSSGTPSAQDSFNHGSITDNAAGDYTVSFSSAFSNVNYTHVGMAGNADTALRSPCQQKSLAAPTTSAARYQMSPQNAASPVDVAFFGVANLGDLA